MTRLPCCQQQGASTAGLGGEGGRNSPLQGCLGETFWPGDLAFPQIFAGVGRGPPPQSSQTQTDRQTGLDSATFTSQSQMAAAAPPGGGGGGGGAEAQLPAPQAPSAPPQPASPPPAAGVRVSSAAAPAGQEEEEEALRTPSPRETSNPGGEGESSEEEHDLLDVVNHAAGALGSGLVSALKFTGDFLKGDVGPSPGARARSLQVSARR